VSDPLRETASQTAGPYVHIGLAPQAAGIQGGPAPLGLDPAGPAAPGARIALEGVVLDGAGQPVRDAVVESWQADAAGVYAHPRDPRAGAVAPGFTGWGRAAADFETGLWRIDTVRPGRVPGADGRPMAPFVALWIVARGINVGLHTRLYFADAAEANAADPLLAALGPRARTLIAVEAAPNRWRLDIRLQGADETAFLDV
jgi:protocatechuate 3,4-dioxygenase alpha subunit